jgi:uncharacterized protein YchJ
MFEPIAWLKYCTKYNTNSRPGWIQIVEFFAIWRLSQSRQLIMEANTIGKEPDTFYYADPNSQNA